VRERDIVEVEVNVLRSDILHDCDLAEDVAIAFGYNSLVMQLPRSGTIAKQQPISKLTDHIRRELSMAGFSEILTLALCSRDENFGHLNRRDDNSAVILSNPATIDFEIVRTNLLQGSLKTAAHNKSSSLPLKLFEISDVVRLCQETDVGAENKRSLCLLYVDQKSGFEVVHGMLDRLMMLLRVEREEQSAKDWSGGRLYYSLSESNDDAFLAGLRADVKVNGEKIGSIGVVHPFVLDKFGIQNPCSALEIEIERFL